MIRLRAADAEDDALIVEMARHDCIIEDWPLPNADDDEVRSLLPTSGEVPIIAVDPQDSRVGAVWSSTIRLRGDPPLATLTLVDPAATVVRLSSRSRQLCVVTAPAFRTSPTRRYGVGSPRPASIDRLADCSPPKRRDPRWHCRTPTLHVPSNPAQKLYTRKRFHVRRPGRGPSRDREHNDLRTRAIGDDGPDDLRRANVASAGHVSAMCVSAMWRYER